MRHLLQPEMLPLAADLPVITAMTAAATDSYSLIGRACGPGSLVETGVVAARASMIPTMASEMAVLRRRLGPSIALTNWHSTQEAIMAKDHGNSVKNDRKYEALRDKGYSKERSAKIANSGKKSSRKGGKHSH